MFPTLRSILWSCCLLLGVVTYSFARAGDLSDTAFNQLMSTDTVVQERAFQQVRTASHNYAPYVFYGMAAVLAKKGDMDAAAFWFYAGQLRTRFDSNRTREQIYGELPSALVETIGPPINQYAFKDIPKLKKTVQSVIAWDKATPHNYDPTWILASTAANKTTASNGLVDATEWPAIAEKTRRDYLAGFYEVIDPSYAAKADAKRVDNILKSELASARSGLWLYKADVGCYPSTLAPLSSPNFKNPCRPDAASRWVGPYHLTDMNKENGNIKLGGVAAGAELTLKTVLTGGATKRVLTTVNLPKGISPATARYCNASATSKDPWDQYYRCRYIETTGQYEMDVPEQPLPQPRQ